jgi:hypothetical protein
MEHFIDNFSKRLANGISRRDVLGITFRAAFVAIFNSSSTSRLFGEVSTSCPDCGTCRMCDVSLGVCDDPCPRPCVTQELCEAASKHSEYRALEDYLSKSRGFVAASSQETIGTKYKGAEIFSLSTFYTSPNPNQTAALFYETHKEEEGYKESKAKSFAIEYSSNSPVFAYSADAKKEISIHAGPISLGSLFARNKALAAEHTDAALVADHTEAASINAGSCPGGEFACTGICGFVAEQLCGEGSALSCASAFLLQPELIPLCVFGLAVACTYTAFECVSACLALACQCPDGCFGCDICQDGQCVSKTCSSGTCVDGSCTTTCASGSVPCPGENGSIQCVVGACPATCPSGEVACGSSCCSSEQVCSGGQCGCPFGTTACGTNCCASGVTCSNGKCGNITCPANYTTCGGGGGCCNPGEPCCINFLGQYGCGNPGTFCCSLGNACPAGTTCCQALTGPTSAVETCCAAGETCTASGYCM